MECWGFFDYLNGNTKSIVVLEQDIDTVDTVHSTKIHLPPHRLVSYLSTLSYCFCPHTRRCVTVHCIFCAVSCSRECVRLRGVLIVWQIILIKTKCLGFIILLENISLIYRRHHYRWEAANFHQCFAWHTYCDTGHPL